MVTIDLGSQLLSVEEEGMSVAFPVNPFRKECLLRGLDNIDYLLGMKDEILAFEKRYSP
jgi:3-isopropylmalate/(R)-2-methylmalate dehydratase small subunit